MEREYISKFTNSVIFLSKLFTTVEDKFLKQKLHEKLSDFIFAFIEQKDGCSLASHNVISKDVLGPINNLLDYLEYLAHISKGNTTPLLLAQKNLLKFKLYIIKQNKVEKVSKAADIINLSPKVPVTADVTTSKLPVRTRLMRLAPKSNSNKEQIFNYIKKTPDVRTKDVVSKFSVLSGRTVKRNLKELIDDGLLSKKSDSGAVYYFIND